LRIDDLVQSRGHNVKISGVRQREAQETEAGFQETHAESAFTAHGFRIWNLASIRHATKASPLNLFTDVLKIRVTELRGVSKMADISRTVGFVGAGQMASAMIKGSLARVVVRACLTSGSPQDCSWRASTQSESTPPTCTSPR
jgi:hypothetical protein